MKKTLGIAAALIVAAVIGISQWSADRTPLESVRSSDVDPALGAVEDSPVPLVQRIEAPSANAAGGIISDTVADHGGTLIEAGGRPAVGIPFWIWSADRPSSTRHRTVADFAPVQPELGPEHGRTDGQGRWHRLPSRPERRRIFALVGQHVRSGDSARTCRRVTRHPQVGRRARSVSAYRARSPPSRLALSRSARRERGVGLECPFTSHCLS